ncbi:hypothetical protein HYPSUDRAFT_44360 [Hypholoma sublateritium FD-334 SS-4]|uniref:Uncharacterized protein n=1 Tax=Hypholoma sublateritium (strain FD-334 SS-4) TaxID=945553 RepID=A0A0D2M7T0_HYPSF|nr:hypothetical protein HYPSUDRAFT_44360 [Hypholoma sublateritium FD-334 SS-4]
MFVQQVVSGGPTQARCLTDAASATLELIAVAEQEDKDKNLDCLTKDAVAFVAAILRSYLASKNLQLWPSPELRDIIIDVTMMLHSATRFVASGNQTRRSKFQFVRRIKIVWDAPKMKAYRKQLASGTLMVQLSAVDTHTATVTLMELHESNAIAENDSGDLQGESGNSSSSRNKERMAPGPLAVPTNNKYIKMAPEIGLIDPAYDTSNAAPEEIFNRTLSRQWSVINITFVSGSAVAIGGGDAHVHTHT